MRITEIFWRRPEGEELDYIKRQIHLHGYISGGDWTGYIEEFDPFNGREAYLYKVGAHIPKALSEDKPIDRRDYWTQQRHRGLDPQEERETKESQREFDSWPKAWDLFPETRQAVVSTARFEKITKTCDWGFAFQTRIWQFPDYLYAFDADKPDGVDFYG